MDQKPMLSDRNFGAVGYKFNRWQAELDEHQTLEDAMRPQFWSAQAEKIMGQDKSRGRGDIIEVRKLSEGMYAELLVTEVGGGFIKVALLRKLEPEQIEVAEDSPLKPRWNVGKRSFDVIREADKKVISAGFQTKATAAAWIEDHMRKLAA